MRPYPDEVLRMIQSGVAVHMLPELTSKYAQAQFAFMSLLFGIAQKDYDGAVPDLLEANRAVRELLAETSSALEAIDRDDARAGAAAIAALPAEETSLRLSALRAENNALRGVLAGLMPLIEPAADVDALAPLRDMRAKIIEHLRADSRKRIVPILTA